ncbi:MAG: DUF5652 family protein [bacterium]|nr:DUF5652 family protein [bacterium]
MAESLMFIENNAWWLLPLMVWTIPWKGYALWRAARLSHRWWFVALLIINTFSILEIFYIFVISKKYEVIVEEKE